MNRKHVLLGLFLGIAGVSAVSAIPVVTPVMNVVKETISDVNDLLIKGGKEERWAVGMALAKRSPAAVLYLLSYKMFDEKGTLYRWDSRMHNKSDLPDVRFIYADGADETSADPLGFRGPNRVQSKITKNMPRLTAGLDLAFEKFGENFVFIPEITVDGIGWGINEMALRFLDKGQKTEVQKRADRLARRLLMPAIVIALHVGKHIPGVNWII